MKDESKVLLSVLSIFAALSVYRTIHFAQTGFFITDEFGYVLNAVHGDIYGDRWFFGGVNALLFKFLGIHSVESFLYLMPFWLFFWPSLTVIGWFKTMKELGFDGRTVTISLVSSLFLVSFMVLSFAFLTEPVGLAMAMCGCFFLIRHMKRPAWFLPAASALCFGSAAYTREPYSVFLVGGVFVVLTGPRKFHSLAAFIAPSAFFLLFLGGDLVGAFSSTAGPALSSAAHVSLSQRLIDTPLIFGFGILLGWGPLLIIVVIAGLLYALRSKAKMDGSIMALASVSLVSYAVVAFIFSIDPTFLTPKSYSTIIRFSDTALPAYFLLAPFAISALCRNRAFSYGLPAALIVFLVASLPVYGSYGAVKLEINPTTPTLAYRTVAAEVRDFLLTHLGGPSILINPPFGWIFTPGVETLSVKAYFSDPTPMSLLEFPSTRVGLYYERLSIPYLSYEGFVRLKPSSFYLFSNTTDASSKLPPYLLGMIVSGNSSSALPFTVSSSRTVLDAPGVILVHIELVWKR